MLILMRCLRENKMKVIYLVIGFNYSDGPSTLFGGYSDEGKAKRRLKEIKNKVDVTFLHEILVDADTEEPI
jgi:hypothetical protein